MMHKTPIRVCLTLAAWLLAASAGAQMMTEQYIPIGAYPNWERGVVRGTLESVDRASKTIVVRTPSGPVRALLGDDTKIWLDRSAMKQTTLTGTLSDLKVGRLVEFKSAGTYGHWVKMKVEP